MAITALPNPPSRSDPANFPERADAFMSALPGFALEANQLQEQVNEAAQAAEENAGAAGGSAQAAATSRNQAAQKATDASTAADAAAQKAVAAEASAALAAQWATKIGAPVDGGEFSAKHYAQLAALGMGLPVFALGNIPSADVGPIFVPTQGAMEWRNGRYVVQKGDHGQCRFVYVSPYECRLMPHNGDGLIINGRQYRIPPGGIPIANTAFTPAAASLVFAKAIGVDSFDLDVAVIGAGHSTHTDGVEIKTGDPGRTLVGMAITASGTGVFASSVSSRRVASWFNRLPTALALGAANTTASTSYVPVSGVIDAVVWGDSAIAIDASGVALSQATGSTGGYYRVTNANTVAQVAGGWGYSLTQSGVQVAAAMPAKFTPAEGYVAYRVEAYTSVAAVPVRWAGDLTVMVMV